MNQLRIYQIFKSFSRDGLIEKREAEDGRAKIYVVTEQGREALQEYYEWAGDRLPEK